jgi:type I restriction enzyme S subunit
VSVELLLRELDRVAEAPNTVKRLRQFVLELAVGGRLVQRSQADGPPSIPSRVGPYNLPPSWTWATVAQIGSARLGKMLDKAKNRGRPCRYLRNVNVRWFDFDLSDLKTMPFEEDELEEFALRAGDVLICEGGEPGRAAVWDARDTDIYFQKAVHRVRLHGDLIPNFFVYYLRAAADAGWLTSYTTGATFQHLTGQSLASLPVPIPPIAEQHLIVAKVDELMALCGQLDAIRKERESCRDALRRVSLQRLTISDRDEASSHEDVRFFLDRSPRLITKPEHVAAIRPAILDLAIQGRLVPQDPRESKPDSAAVGAKAPFGAVSDDELPFRGPPSWTWERLGSIAKLINGDRSKNYPNQHEYVPDGIPWINTGHIERDGTLSRSRMHYISRPKFDSLRGGKVQRDDLVYCLRGATIGKTAIVDQWDEGAIASSLVIVRLDQRVAIPKFIRYYLVSPTGQKLIRRFDNGSAQPNLAANSARLYVVPIPPPAEQERIVSKVDELMAVCHELETALASAQMKRGQLLEVLLHEILNEGSGQVAADKPLAVSTAP